MTDETEPTGVEPPTPAPKKKRRRRAELKEIMIEGGLEVLRDHGIELQISSVSYAKVFEHIERTRGIRITYGSVHERIWNSLQEYQLEVIRRAGLWDGTTSTGDHVEAVLAHVEAADRSTPDKRMQVAREICRVLGSRYQDAVEEADDWSTWLQTVVTMSTQPEGSVAREAARDGARSSYEMQHALARSAYGAVQQALGLEARDIVVDHDQLDDVVTWLTTAAGEGLDLRSLITEEDQPTVRLRTGPNGEIEEWSLSSIALMATLQFFYEFAEG